MKQGNHGDLISVIIPIKNSAQYLRECLDSVQNQTYRNIEIICVVSPSSDDSMSIVCEYASKDSRFRVFYREQCLNIGHARQIGITVAAGKYIGFVDSDDVVHPWMYEFLINMMTQQQFSSIVDIVQCQYTRDLDDLSIKRTGALSVDLMSGRSALMESAGKLWLEYVVLWNKLWRREMFSNVVFPDTGVSEEQDVVHRILYNARYVCRMQIPLYYWRKHPESLTNRPFDKSRMVHINFGQKRLDYYDDIHEDEIADLMARRLCLDYMWIWDEMKHVQGAEPEIQVLKAKRRELIRRIIRSSHIPLTRRIKDAVICISPAVGHIVGMEVYD